MHNISYKILNDFQVRKTRKQKTQFIELLKNYIENNEGMSGIEFKVEQKLGNRNIIIGDIENAEYILSGHYDTPAVLPVPNFLAPRNSIANLLYSVFLISILYAFVLGESIIVLLVMTIMNFDIASYVGPVIMMFQLFVLWAVYFGKANRHTANDNTSGVITVIEALHNEEIRKKTAFVLFDNEEKGLIGSRLFLIRHKKMMKDKILINCDCVGDGDYIMMILSRSIASSANNKTKAKIESSFRTDEKKTFLIYPKKGTHYSSDQIGFPHYIGIAAFKKKKIIGYYLDRIHTRKDTILDERNIKLIVEWLYNYIS